MQLESNQANADTHSPSTSRPLAKVELCVPGEPATFATRGEKPWKEAVHAAASQVVPSLEAVNGVSLDFILSSFSRNGHPFDLDNLCDPVFVSLKNAGWFGGKKSNVKWWRATKALGPVSGVRIVGQAESPPVEQRQIIVQEVYQGELPHGGQHEGFATWARRIAETLNAPVPERIGIGLRFGSSNITIAEIASGRVKNIIDCLYPIIGGEASAPHDWKVHELWVERSCLELGEVLDVMVWTE